MFFTRLVVEFEENSEEIVPQGRQISISRLSGRGGNLFLPSYGTLRIPSFCMTSVIFIGADTPEFCYQLRSCSRRIIDNALCTIGENNLLDVKLFTPDLGACRNLCESTAGCR